jgi:IS4 transposase
VDQCARSFRERAESYRVFLYGKQRDVLAFSQVVTLKTMKCPVRVVWVFRRSRYVALVTTDLSLNVEQIIEFYGARWKIELFFKWIKQHLRIKSYFGTSENAVKSQIRIAISVYVVVAIIKKRLDIDADLYTILQILSLTLFEKTSLIQLVTGAESISEEIDMPNQLNLFDNLPGQ